MHPRGGERVCGCPASGSADVPEGRGVERIRSALGSGICVLRSKEMLRPSADLGVMLSCGEGIERDHDQSVHWLSRRQSRGWHGHNPTWDCCTQVRSRVHGLCRSPEVASVGRRAGDPGSQGELGQMYLHGKGVEKDLTEAFKWLSGCSGTR